VSKFSIYFCKIVLIFRLSRGSWIESWRRVAVLGGGLLVALEREGRCSSVREVGGVRAGVAPLGRLGG
jgi:hypothetical protein